MKLKMGLQGSGDEVKPAILLAQSSVTRANRAKRLSGRVRHPRRPRRGDQPELSQTQIGGEERAQTALVLSHPNLRRLSVLIYLELSTCCHLAGSLCPTGEGGEGDHLTLEVW